jgi:hypothetical protein
VAWSDWAGIATTGVLGAAGLYFAARSRTTTSGSFSRAVSTSAASPGSLPGQWTADQRSRPKGLTDADDIQRRL